MVLLGLNFGVSREFPSNFADRDLRDSSDPLLYQLSYLGGDVHSIEIAGLLEGDDIGPIRRIRTMV